MSWQGGTGSTPAPGWYPDPGQRFEQRYWDGGRWTEHVVKGGQRTVDAPGGAPQRQAQTPAQGQPPAPAVAPAQAETRAWSPAQQPAPPQRPVAPQAPQQQAPAPRAPAPQAPQRPGWPQQGAPAQPPAGQQPPWGQAAPGPPAGQPWGQGGGFPGGMAQPAPQRWTNRALTGRYAVPGHVINAPSAAALEMDRRPFAKGLVQTLGVFAFLIALVFGSALLTALPGAEAGPAVEVTQGLRVQPLSGWKEAERADGEILFTRGSGNLHVATETGASAGDEDRLITDYLSGLATAAKGGDIGVTDSETVTLPNGLRARRLHYQGQFSNGSAVTIQGEVTAVVSASGLGVVFNGFSSPDLQPYIEDDVHDMIEKAVIS